MRLIPVPVVWVVYSAKLTPQTYNEIIQITYTLCIQIKHVRLGSFERRTQTCIGSPTNCCVHRLISHRSTVIHLTYLEKLLLFPEITTWLSATASFLCCHNCCHFANSDEAKPDVGIQQSFTRYKETVNTIQAGPSACRKFHSRNSRSTVCDSNTRPAVYLDWSLRLPDLALCLTSQSPVC